MSLWKSAATLFATSALTVALIASSGCEPQPQANDRNAQDDAADDSSPQIDIDVPGADVEIRKDEESGKLDVDVQTPE